MFCTEKSRRRKTKPLKVTQQHTSDSQPNGHGRVEGEGHGFETQIEALIGLNGLKRSDNFEHFTNRDIAGNFVDIMYTADDRWYIIQPKHADNLDENKLTNGELVIVLQIRFKSYSGITNKRNRNTNKSEFIIYTNRNLRPELSEHTRIQTRDYVFFKTRDKEIFKFVPVKIKKLTYTLL